MLHNLKIPAAALAVSVAFLGFLAWQDPVADPNRAQELSADTRMLVVSSGCQNLELSDEEFLGLLDRDVSGLPDDSYTRIINPNDDIPPDQYLVSYLLSGDLIIFYDSSLDTFEFQSLQQSTLVALSEMRIPLRLIPVDGWDHQGSFRFIHKDLRQECVVPSPELIEFFWREATSIGAVQ